MFKKNGGASRLFMAALTLGFVAITFWNAAAGQTFAHLSSLLSEVLATTIYLVMGSVLTIVLGTIAAKLLRQNSARYQYGIHFLFLALCMALAAFTVYHSEDFYLSSGVINSFYYDASTYFSLATNPKFWSYSTVEALDCVNWLWTRLLFFCLLTISVFLILPLWREAHKNGQRRWIGPMLCLGLLLTFIVDNLANFYALQRFYFPVNGYGLIWLLYDAAPFLGLSALILAMLTREPSRPLTRKIWLVGLTMTFILSLYLVAMAFEIRDILVLSFTPMHYWPATPIATMSALSIAILSMIVALIMVWRSPKTVAISTQTNPQANLSEVDEEAEDIERFGVEMTDL